MRSMRYGCSMMNAAAAATSAASVPKNCAFESFAVTRNSTIGTPRMTAAVPMSGSLKTSAARIRMKNVCGFSASTRRTSRPPYFRAAIDAAIIMMATIFAPSAGCTCMSGRGSQRRAPLTSGPMMKTSTSATAVKR